MIWVKHIHANKIRKFVARANGCGVISQNDSDFGKVLQPNDDVCVDKSSQRIDGDHLSHLSLEKRNELLSVLNVVCVCVVR